ncbi:hypothetical protein LH384_34240, partial [Pseudomonas aeruginosa]|nr:hypothetical protein [Pseudomonas aeruginosa]
VHPNAIDILIRIQIEELHHGPQKQITVAQNEQRKCNRKQRYDHSSDSPQPFSPVSFPRILAFCKRIIRNPHNRELRPGRRPQS